MHAWLGFIGTVSLHFHCYQENYLLKLNKQECQYDQIRNSAKANGGVLCSWTEWTLHYPQGVLFSGVTLTKVLHGDISLSESVLCKVHSLISTFYMPVGVFPVQFGLSSGCLSHSVCGGEPAQKQAPWFSLVEEAFQHITQDAGSGRSPYKGPWVWGCAACAAAGISVSASMRPGASGRKAGLAWGLQAHCSSPWFAKKIYINCC